MLAITIYCTESYTYAMRAQVPLVLQAIRYANVPPSEVMIIIAGDNSKKVQEAIGHYKQMCDAAKIHKLKHITVHAPVDGKGGDHSKATNKCIARMQEAAWSEARMMGADMVWSLESDILPSPKVLRCMLDAIAFDNGWYDIAMCTYPNSEFLGGRASPHNWILPSVYPDERALTDEVKARMEAKKEREKVLIEAQQQPTEEDIAEWRKLDKDVEKCPAENVWALNAKGWRKRGWLTSAYPAIGLGAILPTDWVGVGCTLLNKRALDVANFTGYDGGTTQDLFLCNRVWTPASMRMAVITHALCSHVKWRTKFNKANEPELDAAGKEIRELVIHYARHEFGGECHGHLRCENRPWSIEEQGVGEPPAAPPVTPPAK
jgi:hypothetical protein